MKKSTVIVRSCKYCGNDFPWEVKGSGRLPVTCSPQCRKEGVRQSAARYRSKVGEIYDPWLWQNTILEWDE